MKHLKHIWNSLSHYQAAGIAGLVAILLSGAVLAPSFAQTATDSAQTQDEVNVELIKERLQKSSVMGTTIGDQKHALVGQVQRVTGEAITVLTTDGNTTILPLENVLLLNQEEETITVDTVVIDSWVTALGFLSEENTFTPAYITVAAESLQPVSQYVSIGSITEITSRQLTLAPRDNPSTTVEIDILRNTDFQDPSGESLAYTDFEADMQVLIVGFAAEDDEYEASTVRSLAPLGNE